MSPSTAEPSLAADELYLKSLTYGLIISTSILSLVVVSLRVSSRLEESVSTSDSRPI